MTLGAVHVVDPWNWDEVNQMAQVSLLASDIRRKEHEFGHDRTILIGDFNMNPFAKAMNLAEGLNAMMTTKCVERRSRGVQGEQFPFFYNPMWSLFGDRTPGPAGTFYHSNSSRGMYGWNMLDQVLLRPSVIPWFEDVRILSSTGTSALQKPSGRPNEAAASDHFPILVTLRTAP